MTEVKTGTLCLCLIISLIGGGFFLSTKQGHCEDNVRLEDLLSVMLSLRQGRAVVYAVDRVGQVSMWNLPEGEFRQVGRIPKLNEKASFQTGNLLGPMTPVHYGLRHVSPSLVCALYGDRYQQGEGESSEVTYLLDLERARVLGTYGGTVRVLPVEANKFLLWTEAQEDKCIDEFQVWSYEEGNWQEISRYKPDIMVERVLYARALQEHLYLLYQTKWPSKEKMGSVSKVQANMRIGSIQIADVNIKTGKLYRNTLVADEKSHNLTTDSFGNLARATKGSNPEEVWIAFDERIALYDLAELREIRSLSLKISLREREDPKSLKPFFVVDPEGRRAAVIDPFGRVYLVDLQKKSIQLLDSEHSRRIDRLLAKQQTGLAALASFYMLIVDAMFIPGGDLLAVAALSGHVYVYDLRTCRLMRSLLLTKEDIFKGA